MQRSAFVSFTNRLVYINFSLSHVKRQTQVTLNRAITAYAITAITACVIQPLAAKLQ